MESKLESPEVFYKFGYTSEKDVEVRFSPEYHRKHNFANTCLGDDYNVKCEWSAFVTLDQALSMEADWKDRHERDFWTEKNYNGIGECRKLDLTRKAAELKRLYGWKNDHKYAPNSKYKIYFVKLTKKESNEAVVV